MRLACNVVHMDERVAKACPHPHRHFHRLARRLEECRHFEVR